MGYDNLDKIKSIIFRPCSNICITHITQLASKDKDNNFKYGHAEFIYKTNKYYNRKYVMSINLNFDSYIVIEDISRDWTDDRSVKVGYLQLPILNRYMKKVVKWFEDEKYDDLYYIENGELHLNPEFKLKEVVQLGLNKGIILSPTVIADNDGIQYEGVELIINNKKCIGRITVDNLIAMQDILKSLNLYQLGLTAASYVGRPDFDVYSNYLSTNDDNMSRESTTAHINREEPRKEIKQFFK